MFELELQPFLLCYFPLFAVIFGFIGYGVITDANARRTYLRRRDMRNEREQLAMPGGAPPVSMPDMAETPTGLLFKRTSDGATVAGIPIGSMSHGDHGHAAVSAETDDAMDALDMLADDSSSAEVAAAKPAAAASAPSGPDDLKKIEGIGPKMSSVLGAAGITTFAELATRTPEGLTEILQAAGVNTNANNPETWAEQAALAAAGDWDGLEKLQDSLVGGRRR